jgi:ribonuclease BN (tRNA processing enzyme)
MKLVLLGTTGYHPNDRRHTACLMIPDLGIVLDAGSAMYRVREHIETASLDIFLTHAHLDHVMGLTFLFDVLYEKNVDRVVVRGEAAKLVEIEKHLFAEALFPVKPPFSYEVLQQDFPLPGGGRLRHFPLEHPGGSIGLRLDWPGHSLAYVTDTTAATDAPYIDAIRGVDLLVHECYFADAHAEMAQLTGHSCITPVAQVAKAAGVGRLCLVHINPLSTDDDPLGVETAREIFPNTILGEDQMVLEF